VFIYICISRRRNGLNKIWCRRVASCLHYLTDGVNCQTFSFYTYFHLREITHDVLRAVCTDVLIVFFVFVSLRLIILCYLLSSLLIAFLHSAGKLVGRTSVHFCHFSSRRKFSYSLFLHYQSRSICRYRTFTQFCPQCFEITAEHFQT